MVEKNTVLSQPPADREGVDALNIDAYPRLARRFFKAMRHMHYGEAVIVTPENHTHRFRGAEDGPAATFVLHDWDVIANLAKRGDVGFAEDYRDGRWETDNLPALLTLATANIRYFEQYFHGRRWYRIFIAFKHFLRRNTKPGSRKNIREHYDLGNAFYASWLDTTMTYSAALFEDEECSLENAQLAKYSRILDQLAAKSGDHILEIGCGWGGFAEAAARRGCRVTGITLSREQESYARQRMEHLGFSDLVDIHFVDYRDVKGTYDHIVSIEMFEAVGRHYWQTYFAALRDRLKPGGKAVIQTITIDDAVFEDYARRSDFIQQYTFPGGMLPSARIFGKEAQKAGLALKEAFHFGHDYARTLTHWLHAFDRAHPAITNMGYRDSFQRMWRFYLSYCIAGFSTRRCNVMQVELTHA